MMFRLLICVTLTIVGRCEVLFQHSTFTEGSGMLSDFSPEVLWGTESLDVVADPADGDDHMLRVHYANGSYSGTKTVERGAAFYAPVITPRDDVMFSFDVFFDDTFDFVKGGKLPGLWGGSYLCSGGRHSDTCFTTRFVWRASGAGEVYAYMPRDQEPGFCDRTDVYCNLNFGNSLGRGRWQYQKNQWQNVAQFVQMNTPGKHDGYIKVFLDGAMVYEIQNVSLRNNASIHIDGFVFSTFFGGGDVSWASTRSTYSYFRNFVLSTESAPVIG